MAIAVDANGGNGGASGTWSHTCTGSNLFLFVSTVGSVGVDDVTSVTYNGVAMTKIASALTVGDRYSTGWYLTNPATGANNVVMSSFGVGAAGCSTSYTGVAQTSPIESSTTAVFTGQTTGTTSLTSANANNWALMALWRNIVDVTSGTGSFNRNIATPYIFDSNGITGAGSYSMTVNTTPSGNANWAEVMVLINPATTTNSSNMFFAATR